MESNILVIMFHKSTSQSYQKAVDLANKFSNYVIDGKIHKINIGKEEIIDKKYDIVDLTDIICKWKLTELYFDDRKITKEDILSIQRTIQCSSLCNRSKDNNMYCYEKPITMEGWHCKLLTNLQRHMPSSKWEHEHENHWYKYGHF